MSYPIHSEQLNFLSVVLVVFYLRGDSLEVAVQNNGPCTIENSVNVGSISFIGNTDATDLYLVDRTGNTAHS